MGNVVGINRGGRPRKPTALKELEGTARKDRANPAEPQVKATRIGAPPADLEQQHHATWAELARAVNKLGVACAGDMLPFRSLVEAYTAARNALGMGDIGEWAKADARFEKWASHFGITLATLPKVNRITVDEKKSDPLDEFGQ